MRYYGVPFSPMVFIPFMGAMIQMKDSPKGAFQQSVIALAGPYFGTAAAVGCAVMGHAADSQLLMALADWGFLINLFNCLPSNI
jgi:Zn-dependent protease